MQQQPALFLHALQGSSRWTILLEERGTLCLHHILPFKSVQMISTLSSFLLLCCWVGGWFVCLGFFKQVNMSQLNLRIFWMFSTICWQFGLQFYSVTHLQDLKLLLTNEESREVLCGPVLLTSLCKVPNFYFCQNVILQSPSPQREKASGSKGVKEKVQVLRNQTLLSSLKIWVWTEMLNKSKIQGTTLIYLVHLNFKINTTRLDKNLFMRNRQ